MTTTETAPGTWTTTRFGRSIWVGPYWITVGESKPENGHLRYLEIQDTRIEQGFSAAGQAFESGTRGRYVHPGHLVRVLARVVAWIKRTEGTHTGGTTGETPAPVTAPEDATPDATVRELLIEHSAEDGTTLTGTTRADGVYKMLRSQGWLWRRSVSDFRLQGSVGKPVKRGPVEYTAKLLREALGVVVRIEVDRRLQPVAETEAGIAASAEARAERLARRAERLGRLSESAERAGKAVFDAIPWGQPLLVGHHSYRADLNRRTKAWNSLGRAYALGREAAQTEAAAETAGARMTRRHAPVTVANRIERQGAEQRRIEREITEDMELREASEALRKVLIERLGKCLMSDTRRDDLSAWWAYYAGQIAYWTEVRAEQIRDGVTPGHSRDTVDPGDFARVRGRWCYVVRANVKTIAVPNGVGGDWTDTTPYAEVRELAKAGTEKHALLLVAFLTAEGDKYFGAMARKRFPHAVAPAKAPEAAPSAQVAEVAPVAEVAEVALVAPESVPVHVPAEVAETGEWALF